jgi:hypothetical protein
MKISEKIKKKKKKISNQKKNPFVIDQLYDDFHYCEAYKTK